MMAALLSALISAKPPSSQAQELLSYCSLFLHLIEPTALEDFRAVPIRTNRIFEECHAATTAQLTSLTTQISEQRRKVYAGPAPSFKFYRPYTYFVLRTCQKYC